MSDSHNHHDNQTAPLKRSRVMDTTNREARQAIADIAVRMTPWRAQTARLRAHAVRPMNTEARRRYLTECARLEHDIAATIAAFARVKAELPAKVLKHSKVSDVQRALDGAMEQLRQVTSMLKGS